MVGILTHGPVIRSATMDSNIDWGLRWQVPEDNVDNVNNVHFTETAG